MKEQKIAVIEMTDFMNVSGRGVYAKYEKSVYYRI